MNIHTLHIFNPEHDIALASNLTNFTAPHAGRQLRSDLGFLPALWAKDGDAVLVDHVEGARKSFSRLRRKLGLDDCLFVDKSQLSTLDIGSVEPWGWDLALSHQLRRWGVDMSILPSLDFMVQTRLLSHRRIAAHLLAQLQMDGTVGEAFECAKLQEVQALVARLGQTVVKAPWSSSGRGVRFDQNEAWISNILSRQGSVMVEPYYNKVKDFGMEFESDGQGGISYVGLSLFKTKNGAYTGNVLATEQQKLETIGRYVPAALLERVRKAIIEKLDLGGYRGPFGVDMMVVKGGLLHPCVEINLRRTMGHVALELTKRYNPTMDDDIRGVMRVIYSGTNYQLKIQRT